MTQSHFCRTLPVRHERAEQGGSLWIWDNKFGSCLGGFHPLISTRYNCSPHLYMVLNTVARVLDESPFLSLPLNLFPPFDVVQTQY